MVTSSNHGRTAQARDLNQKLKEEQIDASVKHIALLRKKADKQKLPEGNQ
jgi:hypothetical protein